MEMILVRRDFSDGDFAERGKRLAQLEAEIGRVESELANARADFKRVLERLAEDRQKLALEIRMGSEEVAIQVTVVMNQPEIGQKSYVDELGRTLRVSKMDTNDLQVEMFSEHE
jgi:hypothetical protein